MPNEQIMKSEKRRRLWVRALFVGWQAVLLFSLSFPVALSFFREGGSSFPPRTLCSQCSEARAWIWAARRLSSQLERTRAVHVTSQLIGQGAREGMIGLFVQYAWHKHTTPLVPHLEGARQALVVCMLMDRRTETNGQLAITRHRYHHDFELTSLNDSSNWGDLETYPLIERSSRHTNYCPNRVPIWLFHYNGNGHSTILWESNWV